MSSVHLRLGHVKNYQIQSKLHLISCENKYFDLLHPQNTQVQGHFANKFNRKYNDFSEDLLRYSTIVAPLIRSLWSLEAAHANAADVFIFWLASAATLNDLFDEDVNKTGIPHTLVNEVTEIYNTCYEEFFKNDIYFVAFLLDPRMCTILLMVNAQQLSGYPMEQFLKLTIHIPSQGSHTHATTSPTAAVPQAPAFAAKYPRAYERLREYLRNMLKPMLERIQTSAIPGEGMRV
jgi:hypothetical protein